MIKLFSLKQQKEAEEANSAAASKGSHEEGTDGKSSKTKPATTRRVTAAQIRLQKGSPLMSYIL